MLFGSTAEKIQARTESLMAMLPSHTSRDTIHWQFITTRKPKSLALA